MNGESVYWVRAGVRLHELPDVCLAERDRPEGLELGCDGAVRGEQLVQVQGHAHSGRVALNAEDA